MRRQCATGTARSRMGAAIIAALTLATLSLAVASPSALASERLDVNSASLDELTQLPGIGPSKAAAIVEEREIAPFKSVDELARVRGIGDATLSELRNHVTVGKAPTKSPRAESAERQQP